MVGRPQEFGKKWSKDWCCDNAKLAGCPWGKVLSMWPQSVEEWKFPFGLLSQFGSLDPLNLGAEW